MDKLFTVAGTSNLNGVVKFRFANDLKGRIKVLAKNGHTDIRLIELPEAMTKERAMAFLEGMESDTVDVETLRAELAADGELADDMTDEFLAEVAARENGK
jgi:hypothetical protein